jgi:hypothetical protein
MRERAVIRVPSRAAIDVHAARPSAAGDGKSIALSRPFGESRDAAHQTTLHLYPSFVVYWQAQNAARPPVEFERE